MRILPALIALAVSVPIPAQVVPAQQAPANPSAAASPATNPPAPAAMPPPPSQAAPVRAADATPAAGAPSDVPPMSASEAYLYAMQPFTNARSAPNDLTDADQWALGIGVARARKQCDRLAAQKLEGEDLLAFGKLCILGQDFEPARRSLIDYLALPQAKSPEVGHLLLTRAFLGLRWITSAESQMESLLSLYPYDASIHLGIDMVADTAAESDAVEDLEVIPRLNEQQLPHILDALAHGVSVPSSNGDTVDVTLLVRDALRCADTLRRSNKPEDAQKIVVQVKADVTVPAIMGTAAYPVIEAAFTRYQLLEQPSPVREFHGSELVATGPPVQHVIPLYDTNPDAHRMVRHVGNNTMIRMTDDRTLVLVFSLAGPASDSAIHQILDRLATDHITPGLKVIAVTSFAANVGIDTPNGAVFANLRGFRSGLPATLPVYIVPDTELQPFAIDMTPAAILFDGKGRILWVNTLSGSPGSIRQMLREMESAPPALPQ